MKELDSRKEDLILKGELKTLFNNLQRHISKVPKNSTEQVLKLSQLRSEIYEDLNQLQHKASILSAVKKLRQEFPEINRWGWHPKQTSKENEPDLTGYKGKAIVVSAEITTSLKPKGILDSRMRNTLMKLNKMKGRKFYFVVTKEMLRRAQTKIDKNDWDITPRQL